MVLLPQISSIFVFEMTLQRYSRTPICVDSLFSSSLILQTEIYSCLVEVSVFLLYLSYLITLVF